LKSASSTALFAALGLIALGAGAPAAKAADLGGDCCADLEERVAELEATTARKGNRKVSLTISGQVTTELMYWNDGGSTTSRRSDVFVTDNTVPGGTYFSFTGAAKISPHLSAGFNITMGLCSGARSHQVNQRDDDATTPAGTCFNGAGDTTTVMTLANWYLDSTQLGRITVGRINTATAGISGIDLSGASVIANTSIGYWQRGMFLISGNTLTGTTWGTLLGGNAVNGSTLSRANAISYTSPTLGGFSVAAAWGENDIWDAALRYAGEFSGFRIAAGVGYIHNSGGLNEVTPDIPGAVGPQPNQWKGSVSIMHVASGLFLNGAFVDQDNDTLGRGNTRLWYAQGGIAKNWTGLGNTVLYGEYARVDDGILNYSNTAALGSPGGALITGSRATVWGLGIVQNIDAASMELFLSYRRYQASQSGCSDSEAGPNGVLHCQPEGVPTSTHFNDMDVVMGGARIKF
jgi:hypothetical protein